MLNLDNFNGKKFFRSISKYDSINVYNWCVLNSDSDDELIIDSEEIGDYFGSNEIHDFLHKYFNTREFFTISNQTGNLEFLNFFDALEYVNSDTLPEVMNYDLKVTEDALNWYDLQEEAEEAGAIFSDD